MNVIQRIVTEVAERKDTSRLDLPPLYDTLDPDALENVASSTDDSLEIKFEYCDCTVRVEADGGIEVSEGELAEAG